jgi:hypothetical protein
MRYFQSSEFTFRCQQIDVSMCGILSMDVSNLSNTSVRDTHKAYFKKSVNIQRPSLEKNLFLITEITETILNKTTAHFVVCYDCIVKPHQALSIGISI